MDSNEVCLLPSCGNQKVAGDEYCELHQLDDAAVSKATVPNLALLTKQAIGRGLISPTQGYASA